MRKLPIVTRSKGSLKYHPASLETILKDERRTGVTPIAIISRSFETPEIFSNFLLHYSNFKKGSKGQSDVDFDTSFYDEIERGNYFKFCEGDMPGIYAHPKPLSIEKDTYILLHLHLKKVEHQQEDPLQHLLLLFCSRIMEINLNDSESKFSLLESVNHLFALSPGANICGDVVLVTQGHTTSPPSKDEQSSSAEDKNALEVFQKINFLFVKIGTDCLSKDLSKKRVSPELKIFILTIVNGILEEFKGSTHTLQELPIYFEKSFDALSCNSTDFKRPLDRKLGAGTGNQVFQRISEGIFSPTRNKIIKSFRNGRSDIYIKLVSGKFEIKDDKIPGHVNHIVCLLKLSYGSISTFKKVVQEHLEMENDNIQLLTGMLKIIHIEIVEQVKKTAVISTKAIEAISLTALKTQESLPYFIENIIKILPDFFKGENNQKLIFGCAIFQKCLHKAKIKYDILFEAELAKYPYISRVIFDVVHSKISEKCVEAMKHALNILPNKMGHVGLQFYDKDNYFREEFLKRREFNLANLESCCEGIKKIIRNLKGHYDLSMQRDMKSNLSINSEELKSIHELALENAEQALNNTLSSDKVYHNKNFEEHVKTLRHRINQAYEGYKVRHERSCNSKVENNVKNEETSNKNPTSKNSDIKTPQRKPPPRPPPPKPKPKPVCLAIQMSLNKLRCKIIFEGNSNEFEAPELSVELAVVILDDGSLLFGDDYPNFSWDYNGVGRSNMRTLKIGKCMLSNHGNWTETLSMGTIDETFLLSLIFRDLKSKIEKKFHLLVGNVVVTVPHWFASVHRRKIQKGFSVAGFKKIRIVDEVLAVCCSTLVETNVGKNVLVLSENSDVVEMAIFVFKRNKLHDAFYGSFNGPERKMTKSLFKKFSNMLRLFYKKTRRHFWEIGYISVAINYENLAWKKIFEEIIPADFRSNIVFNEVINEALILYNDMKTETKLLFDCSRIKVLAQVNEKKYARISKYKGSVTYYEVRNSKMFLVGTLTLKENRSSYDVIPRFEADNGCLNLNSVNIKKANIRQKFKNILSSKNYEITLNPEEYNFCAVEVGVSSEIEGLVRQLIKSKYPNPEGNTEITVSTKLQLKRDILKTAYDKGEINFKSTIAQKLFLKDLGQVKELLCKNASEDELLKKLDALEKFVVKYLPTK